MLSLLDNRGAMELEVHRGIESAGSHPQMARADLVTSFAALSGHVTQRGQKIPSITSTLSESDFLSVTAVLNLCSQVKR